MASTAGVVIGAWLAELSIMSDRPPPDYEKIERDSWKEPRAALRDEIRESANRLLARVSTFVTSLGCGEEAGDRRRRRMPKRMDAASESAVS